MNILFFVLSLLLCQLYQCDISQVNATGKWPIEVLKPKTKGYTDIEFTNGVLDWTKVPSNVFSLVPIETAKSYSCQGDARIGYLLITGADGTLIKGVNCFAVQLTTCKNCSVTENAFGFESPTWGFRAIRGCENIEVYNNKLIRTKVTTDNDAIATVIGAGFVRQSDGTWKEMKNRYINIHDNIIRGYTDAFQPANSDANFPPWTLFDEVPGCRFANNRCTVGREFMLADGTYPPWAEQVGVDIKTGGTEKEPLVIENNLFYGRVVSERNPMGYQSCIHNQARNVIYRGNHHIDSPFGISLAPPRNYPPYNTGKFDRNLVFEHNVWDVDCAIYATNEATFSHETFYGRVENTLISSRIFTDCIFAIQR